MLFLGTWQSVFVRPLCRQASISDTRAEVVPLCRRGRPLAAFNLAELVVQVESSQVTASARRLNR